MYLHDLLSSRLRSVLATWVSGHKLMPAAPAWEDAVSSNGVFSENLMSNHKTFQVNVLPLVPPKSVKRILIDAALGNKMALMRLSEMFELGLGVPVLPAAAQWCRAYDPRNDSNRSDLAALIKSVRYSVRQQRMAYADELKGLLPASYAAWLLNVRNYLLPEKEARVKCSSDFVPVLLVYVNKAEGVFQLCDAFTLFGEDMMAASIGHHIVRFPNVVRGFTNTRLKKQLYVGVLCVASMADGFAIEGADYPVTAHYALTGCHRDELDCIALDMFYTSLTEASEHRRGSAMVDMRQALDVRLRRSGVVAEKQEEVKRALDKGQVRLNGDKIPVSVNVLRETCLASLSDTEFSRLMPALSNAIDWYAKDKAYNDLAEHHEELVAGMFNSLTFHALDMAVVSASDVRPFKTTLDLVTAALKEAQFSMLDEPYSVKVTKGRIFNITRKVDTNALTSNLKQRRAVRR